MRARVLGLGGVCPGGGRCRRAGRAVVAGGNAAGGVAPMAVPEGKRRAAAVAVPYSPRPPPRRPRSRRLVPVCLVRAEAGPWRQCRRARDPPHAPGSVSVWLRSGLAGGGTGGVGGRPPLFQARAEQRGESRPGLGIAPKRPRLFVLGERGVWQQSLLPPLQRGPEWLRSKGWTGTAGTGEELSGLRSRAVTAELCGGCPALGAPLCSPRVCAVPVLNVEGVARAFLRRCTSVHPEVCGS